MNKASVDAEASAVAAGGDAPAAAVVKEGKAEGKTIAPEGKEGKAEGKGVDTSGKTGTPEGKEGKAEGKGADTSGKTGTPEGKAVEGKTVKAEAELVDRTTLVNELDAMAVVQTVASECAPMKSHEAVAVALAAISNLARPLSTPRPQPLLDGARPPFDIALRGLKEAMDKATNTLVDGYDPTDPGPMQRAMKRAMAMASEKCKTMKAKIADAVLTGVDQAKIAEMQEQVQDCSRDEELSRAELDSSEAAATVVEAKVAKPAPVKNVTEVEKTTKTGISGVRVVVEKDVAKQAQEVMDARKNLKAVSEQLAKAIEKGAAAETPQDPDQRAAAAAKQAAEEAFKKAEQLRKAGNEAEAERAEEEAKAAQRVADAKAAAAEKSRVKEDSASDAEIEKHEAKVKHAQATADDTSSALAQTEAAVVGMALPFSATQPALAKGPNATKLGDLLTDKKADLNICEQKLEECKMTMPAATCAAIQTECDKFLSMIVQLKQAEETRKASDAAEKALRDAELAIQNANSAAEKAAALARLKKVEEEAQKQAALALKAATTATGVTDMLKDKLATQVNGRGERMRVYS